MVAGDEDEDEDEDEDGWKGREAGVFPGIDDIGIAQLPSPQQCIRTSVPQEYRCEGMMVK